MRLTADDLVMRSCNHHQSEQYVYSRPVTNSRFVRHQWHSRSPRDRLTGLAFYAYWLVALQATLERFTSSRRDLS